MFSNFDTWHSLCSEPCCTALAAEQDNGVGKRGRCPSRVCPSRHTVIVFDKDDDSKIITDISVELTNTEYIIKNKST